MSILFEGNDKVRGCVGTWVHPGVPNRIIIMINDK